MNVICDLCSITKTLITDFTHPLYYFFPCHPCEARVRSYHASDLRC